MSIARVLFALLVAGFATPAFAADKIVSTTDLTAPFHTRTPWHLEICQGPDESGMPGDIHLCFLHAGARLCPPLRSLNMGGDVTIVRAGKATLLEVVAAKVFVTSESTATLIWTYRPKTDNFDLVFASDLDPTNNEDARLETTGPLAGAVIVAKAPGENAPSSDPLTVFYDAKTPTLSAAWPYRYGVALYAPTKDWHYRRVLNYRAQTNEADHVPLGVIDSEMPEIERRLGLWKPGDALPKPQGKGHDCLGIYLHHGVEYCKLLRAHG
jgi:hypothetical protein